MFRQNTKLFFNPVRNSDGQPAPFQQAEHFTQRMMQQYQVEGMEWLRILWENGINGILADEWDWERQFSVLLQLH